MIACKTRTEVRQMRLANALVADILAELRTMVADGVATRELDALAEERVHAAGAIPAFKGYHGYPATLCTSINNEVVHGIPSSRRLREGDVISIDLGVVLEDYYGDAAVTVAVGAIDAAIGNLLRVTEESLQHALDQARPGGRLSDLGHAVQQHVETHGYSVVREFVGHGIGRSLHEEPQVPNYGTPGRRPRLAVGMVLAIEPMVAMGNPEVRVLNDGWTAVTRDGSTAAHFEHTVAITEEGPLVLSRPLQASDTGTQAGAGADAFGAGVEGV